MDPLTMGALAAGGANLLGTAANAWSQNNINKQQMKFQRDMWNATNKYNSPIEQRKRLEAAGLNPNLIYGSSPSGAAGDASMAAQPDLKAPDYGSAGAAIGGSMQSYFNMKGAETSIDVNRAREEQIKQDTINASIDSVNKAIRNAHTALDYKTKHRLYNNTVKTAEERLRNLSIQSDYTSAKNTREERVTNETVQKLSQEIKNAKTQGRILSEDAIMKRVDRELYEKYRIRPQDDLYYRVIGEILEMLNMNPFKN